MAKISSEELLRCWLKTQQDNIQFTRKWKSANDQYVSITAVTYPYPVIGFWNNVNCVSLLVKTDGIYCLFEGAVSHRFAITFTLHFGISLLILIICGGSSAFNKQFQLLRGEYWNNNKFVSVQSRSRPGNWGMATNIISRWSPSASIYLSWHRSISKHVDNKYYVTKYKTDVTKVLRTVSFTASIIFTLINNTIITKGLKSLPWFRPFNFIWGRIHHFVILQFIRCCKWQWLLWLLSLIIALVVHFISKQWYVNV